ncbi:MAG: helix-turn-helix domain-containing protein [Thermodesulfobacteriota bacterium]|nr:helix-turn-helix domain-containing protein [Thermodesulfobacteriota bacterium]
MVQQAQKKGNISEEFDPTSFPVIEEVIEKKLDQIVTVLGCGANANGGNGLYDAVLSIVDRAMIKIAMRRSNNVKSAAADLLGISRNTLHAKIKKLKIPVEKADGEG